MAMMASCSMVAAQTTTEQYPSAAEIAAAQASVKPYSPVSNVHGKVFNRFIDIWLENTVSHFLPRYTWGHIGNGIRDTPHEKQR